MQVPLREHAGANMRLCPALFANWELFARDLGFPRPYSSRKRIQTQRLYTIARLLCMEWVLHPARICHSCSPVRAKEALGGCCAERRPQKAHTICTTTTLLRWRCCTICVGKWGMGGGWWHRLSHFLMESATDVMKKRFELCKSHKEVQGGVI